MEFYLRTFFNVSNPQEECLLADLEMSCFPWELRNTKGKRKNARFEELAPLNAVLTLYLTILIQI